MSLCEHCGTFEAIEGSNIGVRVGSIAGWRTVFQQPLCVACSEQLTTQVEVALDEFAKSWLGEMNCQP